MLSVPMLGFFSLDPSGVKAGSVLSSTGCEPSCALAHQDHWDLALCLCKEHSRAATLGFYRCEGFPLPSGSCESALWKYVPGRASPGPSVLSQTSSVQEEGHQPDMYAAAFGN